MKHAEGGIEAVRDPSAYPMDQRSERFIRVTETATQALLGYAEINPDGSALFRVPADTSFTMEVVNANLKAIASKDSSYNYLQDISAQSYSVAADETLAYFQSPQVNPGAEAAGVAFENTDATLVASAAGQTMAEVLAENTGEIEAISAEVHYTDVWSVGYPSMDIDYSYSNLGTTAPVSAACLNDWTADCSADISYLQNIQPIWEMAGRDGEGRSCVACHDNSGATGLDLTWDGVASTPAEVASYSELLSARATYMYLANSFETVKASHCATYAELPLTSQPHNDCFTCFARVLMSTDGALESANFYEVFGDGDGDDDNYVFTADEDALSYDHSGMLSKDELRMISEWLDKGAPLN